MRRVRNAIAKVLHIVADVIEHRHGQDDPHYKV